MPGAIRINRQFSFIAFILLLLLGLHSQTAFGEVLFDVPEQKLVEGLEKFAAQAGVNFSSEKPIDEHLRSRAIAGYFSPREALDKLLEGTQLYADWRTPQNFIVKEKPEREARPRKPATVHVPAYQSTASASPPSDKRAKLEEVTVNASGWRDNLTGTQTFSVNPDVLLEQGYHNVEQFYEQLPQDFPGVSRGSNPSIGDARGAGRNQTFSATADLRGLGPGTTAILMDNRKLARSIGGEWVDISSIPLMVMERIDTVLDGASALYGADSPGGVVNLVTRRKFNGVKAVIRSGGISRGKGSDYVGSLLAGLETPNTSLVVGVGYDKDASLFSSARASTANASGPTTLFPEQQMINGYLSLEHTFENGLVARGYALGSRRRYDALDSTYGYFSKLNGQVAQLDTVLQLDYAVSSRLAFGTAVQLPKERDYVVTDYPASKTQNTDKQNTDNYLNQNPTVDARMDAVIQAFARKSHLAIGATSSNEEFHSDSSYAPQLRKQRHVDSVFGELNIPVPESPGRRSWLNRLVLNVSARYDDYADVGHSVSPSASAKFSLLEGLTLKSSITRSSRSATLYELHSAQFAQVVPANDPTSPGGLTNTLLVDGGNPRLQPEHSGSESFGFEWAPPELEGLKLDVSQVFIDYTGRIDQLSQDGFPSELLVQDAPILGRLVTLKPTVAQVQQVLNTPGLLLYSQVDPANIGAIAHVGYANVGSMSMRILDTRLRYKTSGTFGRFTGELNTSWFEHSVVQITPESASASFVGKTYRPSRFRGRLNVGLQNGHWDGNFRLNYTGSYHDPGNPACRMAQGCSVSQWPTADLRLAYSIRTESRPELWDISVALSATNLFQRGAPYVYGIGRGINFDPANANVIGRTVGLTISLRLGGH